MDIKVSPFVPKDTMYGLGEFLLVNPEDYREMKDFFYDQIKKEKRNNRWYRKAFRWILEVIQWN